MCLVSFSLVRSALETYLIFFGIGPQCIMSILLESDTAQLTLIIVGEPGITSRYSLIGSTNNPCELRPNSSTDEQKKGGSYIYKIVFH